MRSTFIQWIVVFACCLHASSSFACRCVYGSLESSFSRADVVLEGTPKSETIEKVDDREAVLYDGLLGNDPQDRVVRLDVTEIWKGDRANTTTIRSYLSSLCGYQFVQDQKIIIFASYSRFPKQVVPTNVFENGTEERRLFTDYCSGNVVLRDYPYSNEMKIKLDRLRKQAENRTGTKRYKALRNRIQEILEAKKRRALVRDE